MKNTTKRKNIIVELGESRPWTMILLHLKSSTKVIINQRFEIVQGKDVIEKVPTHD